MTGNKGTSAEITPPYHMGESRTVLQRHALKRNRCVRPIPGRSQLSSTPKTHMDWYLLFP